MSENHIDNNSTLNLDIHNICKSASNQVSGLAHLRNYLDQRERSVFCNFFFFQTLDTV